MIKILKIVLSGAGCCGKTTIINELEKKGFDVLEEIPRKVLEERKNFLVNFEEIKTRQLLMLERQVEQEKEFDDNPPILDLIFCDRSCVDILAYFEHYLGEVPQELVERIKKLKYDKIFVLDRLKLENDGTRVEKDDNEAQKIHKKIIECYKKLGYDVVEVPVMEIDKRASFILKNIFN